MKIIRQVDWTYSLYEDENGRYILEIVIPSSKAAWANYDKQFVLPWYEKIFIRLFPKRTDVLADKFLKIEKNKNI